MNYFHFLMWIMKVTMRREVVRTKMSILRSQKRIWGRIANEVLMLLRSNRKNSREVSLYEPIGVDKDGETVSLLDVMEINNKEVLDSIILEQDIKELYEAYATCLREREQRVIRMRYGLFGGKEYTQREIADQMGISRSYVSRIEKRALEKMRRNFTW